jgi:hypothetical protein
LTGGWGRSDDHRPGLAITQHLLILGLIVMVSLEFAWLRPGLTGPGSARLARLA